MPYYNRGKARTELQNFQGAIADYNQAIKLDPNLPEAYGNRGFLRARLGNKQKGLEDLQQAAKLFLDSGNMAGYQQTLTYIQMIKR
jgi:tetratricopeptide (TPR) repeat protein